MDLNNPTTRHKIDFRQFRNKTITTCICRRETGRHEKAGKVYLVPMGTTRNLTEARDLYNNPENHWIPFEEGDKIWLGLSL